MTPKETLSRNIENLFDFQKATLEQARLSVIHWANIETDYADNRAKSWYYLMEAKKLDSDLLTEVATLLLIL